MQVVLSAVSFDQLLRVGWAEELPLVGTAIALGELETFESVDFS